MRMLAVAATVLLASTAAADFVNEDFEGGVIPAGWTVVDNMGTDLVFDIGPGFNGSMYSVGFDSDANPGYYDTELWTPVMNLVGVTNPVLDFDAYYEHYIYDDQFDVDVSYDGGATWANLLAYTDDMGIFHASVGFDGGSAETIIRFHYYSTNDWDWWVWVDDVVVTPTPGALALLGLAGLVTRRRR
ncbi:MAG: choice-of-anchor J domain-containing protein [Phycisphaerales bacterium]|nr:MAG: choice-of-anchor J domain-containing protein [Phycisphaerales bacterium]